MRLVSYLQPMRLYMRKSLILLLLLSFTLVSSLMAAETKSRKTVAPADAPLSSYKLELEINALEALPFLKKFGKMNVVVYPGGVRARSILVDGFSTTGTDTITVENGVTRLYHVIPVSEFESLVRTAAGGGITLPADLEKTIHFEKLVRTGTVAGIPAVRHRAILGPDSWIDVWTTTRVPKNPQFTRLSQHFLKAVVPSVARLVDKLPGTPVYVELETERFHKLALLKATSLATSSVGETDDLKVAKYYVKAPKLADLFE